MKYHTSREPLQASFSRPFRMLVLKLERARISPGVPVKLAECWVPYPESVTDSSTKVGLTSRR